MNWSREVALLLDGTSIRPDARVVSRIRIGLQGGIDWSELLRIAIPHGVLPLLGRNLEAFGEQLAPAETLVQLTRFSKRARERNGRQLVELSRIISELYREGIRALPFKGPTLALQFYGDIGLRESHDLDLWIDPSQFVRAGEWCRANGYSPIEHVRGHPQEARFAGDRHGEFANPDGTVILEIKERLEPSKHSQFDPPFEQVWERRGRAILGGGEMPVFGVEDLLPSLAVHGSKHVWRRLHWIVDIAAVISASGASDWETMDLRAAEWRCRQRLAVAVALADSFYATGAPGPFRALVQSRTVRAAVVHIRSTIFGRDSRTVGSLRSEYLFGLHTSDSASEAMRWTRGWLARMLQAEEGRMVVPMSGNLRRVYSIVTGGRRLLAGGKAHGASVPRLPN